MNFFQKVRLPITQPDDTILALDIGSEFVKAILASAGENHSLEISGIGFSRQKPNYMIAGAIADIDGVIKTCEEAISGAERRAGITAKKAVVGIAGELIKGDTARIHYSRKNSNTPLTQNELNKIIKKAQNHAKTLAEDELINQTNNPEAKVKLINSAIISTYIDGYKINNPLGFKGSKVTLELYTAFAPLIHISAIEKVCMELELELVAVAVEPFSACRACMGDDNNSDLSAIVIDVGGGTTDIAIINDGGVEGTKMFGIGGRSFTHQIAITTGTDLDTAERLKIIPERINLPDHIKQKSQLAIAQNLEVWLSGIQLALSDFSVEALPVQILLCGGGAGLYQLQELLATTDWFRSLAFARRPLIHLLNISDIPGVKNNTTVRLDHNYITALGLLRVGFDTMRTAPTNNGIKSKLARLLQN